MGKSTLIRKYEITPELKALQELGYKVSCTGATVDVDITRDLVTINGYRKYTRAEAKPILLVMLEDARLSQGSNEFADSEKEAKLAKLEAKKTKKKREPGTPPELQVLLRRAKRIYKKSVIKGIEVDIAITKAQSYIQRKAQDEDDINKASELLSKWLEKTGK